MVPNLGQTELKTQQNVFFFRGEEKHGKCVWVQQLYLYQNETRQQKSDRKHWKQFCFPRILFSFWSVPKSWSMSYMDRVFQFLTILETWFWLHRISQVFLTFCFRQNPKLCFPISERHNFIQISGACPFWLFDNYVPTFVWIWISWLFRTSRKLPRTSRNWLKKTSSLQV